MGRSLRRFVGLLPAVTGVILAGGLLAPSAARGECGTYVTYTNPADARPMGDHGPMPGRCHGPNCSQTPPAAPMPPAPPHLRILADDSLPPSGGEAIPFPNCSTFPVDPADGSPIRRPADVYHPPR